MANRGCRMTKGQKDLLINYFEKNSNMLNPKQPLTDLPKVELLWQTFANTLNCLKGANKSVKQWKEAWNELNTNVRRKARENVFDIQGTGGGPKTAKVLTELENRIITLISKISIEGAPLPKAGVYVLIENAPNALTHPINENSEQRLFMQLGEAYQIPRKIPPFLESAGENVEEVVEYILQNDPETEVNQAVRPKPRQKRKIKKNLSTKVHQLQQIVNSHGKCLHNVTSSNEKTAQAILALGASIFQLGRKKKIIPSAVYQIKF